MGIQIRSLRLRNAYSRTCGKFHANYVQGSGTSRRLQLTCMKCVKCLPFLQASTKNMVFPSVYRYCYIAIEHNSQRDIAFPSNALEILAGHWPFPKQFLQQALKLYDCVKSYKWPNNFSPWHFSKPNLKPYFPTLI